MDTEIPVSSTEMPCRSGGVQRLAGVLRSTGLSYCRVECAVGSRALIGESSTQDFAIEADGGIDVYPLIGGLKATPRSKNADV